MNCVYLIGEKGTDRYKIGYTKNIKQRLRCLQTSNPRTLEIVHLIKCVTIKPRLVEKKVQSLLRYHRKKGEWFTLKPEYVTWLKSIQSEKDIY